MGPRNCTDSTSANLQDIGLGREVARSFIHSEAVCDKPVALPVESYAKNPYVILYVTTGQWLTLTVPAKSECDGSPADSVEPLRLFPALAGMAHFTLGVRITDSAFNICPGKP